ncbi:MAG: exosortase H [Thermoanaerobaculia bacterium]
MKKNTRFLLTFFGVLVIGYVIITLRPVNDRVIVPFTHGVAEVSGHALRWIGQDVTITGTVIGSTRFAVDIHNGCNGVEAMLILIAAIGAFPAASIRARVLGVLIGAVALQAINIVRIVSLYLLGRYDPQHFQMFHTGVWQVLIIAVSIAIFLFWSVRFAGPREARP